METNDRRDDLEARVAQLEMMQDLLIRLISIPDTYFATAGRGIGIFISLIAAVLLIVAGLLRAAEEL